MVSHGARKELFLPIFEIIAEQNQETKQPGPEHRKNLLLALPGDGIIFVRS